MNTQTTIILGAGASIPYGYPSGVGLVEQLIHPEHCDNDYALRQTLAQIHHAASPVFEPDLVRELCYRLEKSRCRSVDRFLEHDANRYLRDVGVYLIARQLLRAMGQSKRPPFDRDLYSHLFDRFVMDNGHFASNLRVVTFNYDLSLEISLAGMFKHRFGLTDQLANDRVAEIDIQHVYGKLSFPSTLGFVELANLEGAGGAESYAVQASRGIRIIADERVENCEEIIAARDYVNQADRLIFLGFGFDPINLKRLHIGQEFDSWTCDCRSSTRHSREVYATMYGLEGAERETCRWLLKFKPAKLLPDSAFTFGDKHDDCLQFLRKRLVGSCHPLS